MMNLYLPGCFSNHLEKNRLRSKFC